MSANKVVRASLDLVNPPPFTDAQRAQIDALLTKPDSDIDTSDVPELTPDFWQSAVSNPFFKSIPPVTKT